jgi:hypothetical protein
MTDVDKKNEIIDDLNNKGMVNADKKLHDNIETVVSNFNKYSKGKELKLDSVLNKILRK